MSFLVWNCHGLGNLRTKKVLGNIIWEKDPSVLFLAETWADKARLDRILHNINFDHKWEVSRGRRGRGLVLFWKDEANVTIEDSHKYFIDATFDKNLAMEWRFICSYGEPETHRRIEAWNKLMGSNSRLNVPWLCVGDFSEIIKKDEKLGGALKSHNQM